MYGLQSEREKYDFIPPLMHSMTSVRRKEITLQLLNPRLKSVSLLQYCSENFDVGRTETNASQQPWCFEKILAPVPLSKIYLPFLLACLFI